MITTSATRSAEPAIKMRVGAPLALDFCERRSRRPGVTKKNKKESVPIPHFSCGNLPLAMKSGKESRVLSVTQGDVSTIALSTRMSILELPDSSSRATLTRDSDVVELDAGQPGK